MKFLWLKSFFARRGRSGITWSWSDPDNFVYPVRDENTGLIYGLSTACCNAETGEGSKFGPWCSFEVHQIWRNTSTGGEIEIEPDMIESGIEHGIYACLTREGEALVLRALGIKLPIMEEPAEPDSDMPDIF